MNYIRAWSLLPILRRHKDPDQVHWQRLNGKMNDEGVIHLNPEWGLREPQSACVILSYEIRSFFPVIIVSLIAPLASLTAGSQLPVFWSWVKDWQLTNCSLRPVLVMTPGAILSQSEAWELGTGPMRSEGGLSGGYCQGLLKHESCQWVNQGNHFYYHLVDLATSWGWDKKVTEGSWLDPHRTKDVQMSCWV